MTEACWPHVFLGHPPLHGGLLILYFRADVKRLAEEGRRFPFPRPERCPGCRGRRVWVHSYVPRYFEGYVRPLWTKKYQCGDCGAVHTLRPSSFWARFAGQFKRFFELFGIRSFTTGGSRACRANSSNTGSTA